MGAIPEETIIKKYGSMQAYKEYVSKKLSGKHFYTNGIVDIKLSDEQIVPEGFHRGRTNGCKGSTSGMIAINNGQVTKFIPPDKELPDGFSVGGKKHSETHNKNIAKSLVGKNRSKEHCINLSKSHKQESYKNRIQSTMQERYGVDNAFQLESTKLLSNSEDAKRKRRQTLKKNGSFGTSGKEKSYLQRLISIYGQDDVVSPYSSEFYPFNCDFYVKSLDLYIEYHGYWTHGKHPYNLHDQDDVLLAESWKNSDNKFYNAAYDNWVQRDVMKLNYMKSNKLNYIVFYNDMYITNVEDEICQKIMIEN